MENPGKFKHLILFIRNAMGAFSKRNVFILLTIQFSHFTLSSQEITPLAISTNNHCLFSGTNWEYELYNYPVGLGIKSDVEKLLNLVETKQNFEIIQSNVENIAAVLDSNTHKRYLLYSKNFIEKTPNKVDVLVGIAHAISHHLNEHLLDTIKNRKAEELEADELMGYLLAQMPGVEQFDIFEAIKKLPSSRPDLVTLTERMMAINAGWKRAEMYLTINSSSFNYDPNLEAFLTAKFPFPPPPCCSPFKINNEVFFNNKTLGQVSNTLCAALSSKGYYYHRFMAVPNGFALITQMEQYLDDYSCRQDDHRWSSVPICDSFKGFFDYFLRLIQSEKANFRTFVFIVTKNAYSISGGNITKDEAIEWSKKGINKLPESIAKTPFTPDYSIESLVYEFEVPKSNRLPKQHCPNIDTFKHLKYSGIWDAILKSKK